MLTHLGILHKSLYSFVRLKKLISLLTKNTYRNKLTNKKKGSENTRSLFFLNKIKREENFPETQMSECLDIYCLKDTKTMIKF